GGEPAAGLRSERRKDARLLRGFAESLAVIVAVMVMRWLDDGIAGKLILMLRRALIVRLLLCFVLLQPRGELFRSRRKQRCRMNEAPFLEMLDQSGAGVLDLLARQDRNILTRGFQRRPGQARQEFVRPHIRQEIVSADDVAGDTGDNAAGRAVLAARQHVDQQGPYGNAQRIHVEFELALLIEQTRGMFAKACGP